MSILDIVDLAHFQQTLSSSGPKLVVVDFTATWCGPCRMIAPIYAQLSTQYAGRALFLKVDVDAAADVAQFCSVSAMPTFHGYLRGSVVFNFSGADRDRLAAEIERHAPATAEVAFAGSGQTLGGAGDSGVPKVDWDSQSPGARRAAAAEAAARRFGTAAPAGVKKEETDKPVLAKKPPSKAAAAAMDSLLAAEEADAAAAVADAKDAEAAAAADVVEGDSGGGGGDGGAEAPVPVQSGVNATMLASLMEMGFPRPRAVRALHATFSRSAEAAMEWCFEHADDTGVDDPLTPLEDVVADPAAAAASGSGRGGGSGSQLTPAERQAKAAALLEKARERRAAEEKAAEIEREKARVREGKELVAAKAKLEEQQRKRVIEERRREKREQLEERQRIRERIAADKAARAERFRKSSGDAVAPEAAPAAAPVLPKSAPLPTAAGGKIQFRLPDGSRLEGTFAADATLAQAAGFVAHERPDVAAAGFQLISQYPKRVFTEADMLTSLADAQLLPRGALTVTPL